MRRISIIIMLLWVTSTAFAQQHPTTSATALVDPADELGKLKKNCPFHKIIGCLEVLFTGQPFHIAVGSIAPQNGFGAGVAYVGHKTTENWRDSWNVDAIGSANGSWRAGIYAKFVYSNLPDIGTGKGTKGRKITNPDELPEQPVINLYAQSISLNKLTYYGLGPFTTRAGQSFYGMTQTIVGASGLKPINQQKKLAIYGEINARFAEIRASNQQNRPSIEVLYTDAAAPGLADQPTFLQLGEGVRFRPSFKDLIRLNYDFSYKQYAALGNSKFSFQRLTFDLSHQFSMYRNLKMTPSTEDTGGPDDCNSDPDAPRAICSPAGTTRDLEGNFTLRALTALSMTPGVNRVPFYFQPTLGGADINGNPSLSSYQDYRFRAPNAILVQERFEHSIGKWPVGVALQADQGKVALTRGGLADSPWLHSFAAGLTLRAGGFPQVYLLFSWGGNEGTHNIVNVNNSLLGSSSRPSLF